VKSMDIMNKNALKLAMIVVTTNKITAGRLLGKMNARVWVVDDSMKWDYILM